jgi:soluble lytic murein transglycosylase-like protein
VAALYDPGWQVPLDDVLAYCQIESSFNARAYRWEAHLGEASWGLMQVLESTARDRGLIGPPSDLYEPEIGLAIGCAHVIWTRDFLASRGAPSDPLSVALAYNAGVGNALRGRTVRAYGEKWLAARARFGGVA